MIGRQLTLTDEIILTPRANIQETRELVARLRELGPVIGTDEAGRGALAGPVIAAAVYLTPEQEDALLSMKLRDSKKITPLGREKLFAEMKELGVLWRACSGSVELIERRNILRASLWTMGMSVMGVGRALRTSPSCVIVDGTERIPMLDLKQWPLIGADNLAPVVSAASIAAKVVRDRIMMSLDEKYPEYNFAKNKGYPTKEHMDAVRRLGMSKVHRPSFCRKILGERGISNAFD